MTVNRNSTMKLLHQPVAGFFVQQILQVQPVEDFVRPIIQSKDLSNQNTGRDGRWKFHKDKGLGYTVPESIQRLENHAIMAYQSKPLVRPKELSVLPRRLMRNSRCASMLQKMDSTQKVLVKTHTAKYNKIKEKQEPTSWLLV